MGVVDYNAKVASTLPEDAIGLLRKMADNTATLCQYWRDERGLSDRSPTMQNALRDIQTTRDWAARLAEVVKEE